MSAIWGCVDLRGRRVTKDMADCMESPFHGCTVDRFDVVVQRDVMMGCCHQYFTKESEKETMPIYEEDRHFLFCGDVILDNRKILMDDIGIKDNGIPDGKLVYEAYKKWGNLFMEHILGAFSCAVFWKREKKLYLFTDHFSNRCLYYARDNGFLYFSTLIEPIKRMIHATVEPRWVSAFLAVPNMEMTVYEELTPYQNIYQMMAAQQITVDASGEIRKQQYWTPMGIKERLILSEQEYKKLVVDTLDDCVSSMLRSVGKTGCTMSSGLDSTTVACMAARKLSLGKQKLYTYTAIPLKDFQDEIEAHLLADESGGVNVVCKHYPNMVPHYMELAGEDAFSKLREINHILECPCKSDFNGVWINEIYKASRKDGCRLVLKGQYGNTTISYGKVLTVLYQEIKALQFGKAYRSMKGFQKRYHVPTKYLLRIFLKEWTSRFRGDGIKWKNCMVKKSILHDYHIKKVCRNAILNTGGSEMDSFHERTRFLFNPQGMMTLGMVDTKMSLYYGVMIRDPLKDKRLVELCCRLPIECTLAGNWERGMVREYMQGIVPEYILKNITKRGLQSADSAYRTKKNWEQSKKMIADTIKYSGIQMYLKDDFFQKIGQKIEISTENTLDSTFLREVNILYSCAIFLH